MAERKAKTLFEKLFGEGFRKRMIEYSIEMFKNSWCEQGVEERRWRMNYLEKLILEKTRIREVHGHGCLMWCDIAAEGIITGDKRQLSTAIDMFLFDGEDESYAVEMRERFKHFRDICQEAHDTMQASRQRGMQA